MKQIKNVLTLTLLQTYDFLSVLEHQCIFGRIFRLFLNIKNKDCQAPKLIKKSHFFLINAAYMTHGI